MAKKAFDQMLEYRGKAMMRGGLNEKANRFRRRLMGKVRDRCFIDWLQEWKRSEQEKRVLNEYAKYSNRCQMANVFNRLKSYMMQRRELYEKHD